MSLASVSRLYPKNPPFAPPEESDRESRSTSGGGTTDSSTSASASEESGMDLKDISSDNLTEDGSDDISMSDSSYSSSAPNKISEELSKLFEILKRKSSNSLEQALIQIEEIKKDELSQEDIDGLTVVDYASIQGYYDLLRWLKECSRFSQETKLKLFSLALCTCAKLNNLEACKQLIQLGANINYEKPKEGFFELLTPLGFAVAEGYIQIAEYFLAQPGIQVNHIHIVRDPRADNYKESLLHLATNNPEMINLLLNAGANPYLFIKPKEGIKVSRSAVHQALYQACCTREWSFFEPYVHFKGLKFDDYEDKEDILNPLIEKLIKYPKDQELINLINRLHRHQNCQSPLYILLDAINHDVKFTSEILYKRCELIENFYAGDEDDIQVEGQVPEQLQIFGRTVANSLLKKNQWFLALNIIERYQVDMQGVTYFGPKKEIIAQGSLVNLILQIEGQTIPAAGNLEAQHFAKGVLFYRSRGASAQGLLDHFIKAQILFEKSGEYIAKIAHDNTLATEDRFVAVCCSTLKDLEPEDQRKSIARLVTKVVYRAKRHSWNEDHTCQLIRNLVETYEPFLKGKDLQAYERWIRDYETRTQDYYGMDLSSTSDEEEEKHFSKLSSAILHTLSYQFKKLIDKAEGARFEKWLLEFESAPQIKIKKRVLDLNNREDMKKAIEKITKFFNQKKRTQESTRSSPEIERDLHILNTFAAQGQLAEGIKSIKTQFVVAQYRGISYDTSLWSAPARRRHRKQVEEGVAYYSAGVYDLANVLMYEDWDEEMTERLAEQAKELKKKLLQLRKEPPFLKKGKDAKSNYGVRAHQIQELYSRSKQEFMAHLPRLNLGTHCNPFVSTGDTPFHALKYAYGIKPYEETRENRLRPRWNRTGKAERPYSGKVYLSLHPIEDYGSEGPLHVPSLFYYGKINLEPRILNERESTFAAYLPEGRVSHTYIAKYPSFNKSYKKIYLCKYGLEQTAYESLQRLIKKFAPHTPENKIVKSMLGEYLCSFHEVRLQKKARQLAKERKSVLVYRSEIGGFVFTRPERIFPNNSKKNEIHKIDSEAIKRRRIESQDKPAAAT